MNDVCVVCGASEKLIPVPHGADGQMYCEDVTPCLNRRNQMPAELNDLVDHTLDGFTKEELMGKIAEAVRLFNQPPTRYAWIIQYNDLTNNQPFVHGFAYREAEQARRVATELERDKVARFGVQIARIQVI